MEQNKQNTALLIMDMQGGTQGRMPDASIVIGNVAAAIAHARHKKIQVIYVVVGFRTGMPEISANNKIFTAAKERLAKVDMKDWMKIHADLTPQEGEVVVTKRRVSAFTGSDLEVMLRAYGISHIVLTGYSTSGVVLSTTREASDKDYQITILKDCCADSDQEVHNVLMNKIFPVQADVLTVAEWTKI